MWLLCVLIGSGALAPAPAAARTARPAAAAPAQFCRSWKHNGAIARRISRGIRAVLARRRGVISVRVNDPYLGIGCSVRPHRHFGSASVVKATILAALLRKAHVQHRHLTGRERRLATLMITRSDNKAASALWNDVGRHSLRTFLRRAGMKEIIPGPSGFWGITRITAHDEMILLQHLLVPTHVLTRAARRYELGLMEHVIRSQRWGVTAGAPDGFNVHVKNGWLPAPPGGRWWVNSIGCFTHGTKNYSIVVLTKGNPSMAYGVTSIEDVAEIVNHDLNPGATGRVQRSRPGPGWGVPDEQIPWAQLSR
jgi:hypothetical protein